MQPARNHNNIGEKSIKVFDICRRQLNKLRPTYKLPLATVFSFAWSRNKSLYKAFGRLVPKLRLQIQHWVEQIHGYTLAILVLHESTSESAINESWVYFILATTYMKIYIWNNGQVIYMNFGKL